MQNLLLGVPNFNTLGASVAQTLASRGISVGEIALLPESEWITNLRGELIRSDNPIQLSYPVYQFVFDFPLVRISGLSADENAAVDMLGRWLLSQHPEAYGLRPAGGAAAETDRLFATAESYGAMLTPDTTQAVIAPPRAEALRLLTWVGGVVR